MGDGARTHDVSTLDGLIAFYDVAFPEVYRSAARLTRGDRQAAEDLVQDAFVRLTRSARDGEVTTVGVGWLVTTVRRLHLDRVRSADREGRRLRLVVDRPGEPSIMAQSEAVSVLDGLSSREQAALILRYVEGLPVDEVADVMRSTVRATESLLQRAKRKAQASRRIS